MDADVVVVGAGHNGLICAAYLARAGVDTLLLEARPDVGGCASTVTALDARFNICNCDHNLIRAMPIADELELDAHGLRYLEHEASLVHRFHDGSDPWVFFHEIDRHLDTLSVTHPDQVDAYRRYLDDALPVAELVLDMARTLPTAPRLMAQVARHRARGAARLLDWSRRSAADVLQGYFDDWHMWMPAISTGPTVWGAAPDTPRTGTAAAIYATRHLVKTGRPAGGSGALTDALRACFEAAGGRTLCGSRVDRLLVTDGAVCGVRLSDATVIRSSRVVAAVDPRAVLVDWLDDPPPSMGRLVRRYRDAPGGDGYESKLDAVLEAAPRYRTTTLEEAIPGVDVVGPTNVVSPTPAELAEAHELRAAGRVAPRPTMLVNVPTIADRDMQPRPDQHVLSLEVLFTPYDVVGGWEGSSEPERWLAVLAELFEPGSLQIDRWRAMTPDRYEREFSMARGHAPSFSASPLVALVGRDRAHTRYRTPLSGLFLTGAGTFPGAGIFGASGRNCAAVVRHDLDARGRRIGRKIRESVGRRSA